MTPSIFDKNPYSLLRMKSVLEILLYSAIGFLLTAIALHNDFSVSVSKNRLVLNLLKLTFLTILILLFSYIGYFTLVPKIRLSGELFSLYSSLVDRMLIQNLLSIIFGYTLAKFIMTNPIRTSANTTSEQRSTGE